MRLIHHVTSPAVCFFLGILFAQFPYDFPLLWTTDEVAPAYLDQLETHLKFIHAAPPLIARILHIMVGTGFLGFFVKLFRPSEANMLFDGAGLTLYVIGVGIYITNIVKGLRTVSADIWDAATGLPVEQPGAPELQQGEAVQTCFLCHPSFPLTQPCNIPLSTLVLSSGSGSSLGLVSPQLRLGVGLDGTLSTTDGGDANGRLARPAGPRPLSASRCPARLIRAGAASVLP